MQLIFYEYNLIFNETRISIIFFIRNNNFLNLYTFYNYHYYYPDILCSNGFFNALMPTFPILFSFN